MAPYLQRPTQSNLTPPSGCCPGVAALKCRALHVHEQNNGRNVASSTLAGHKMAELAGTALLLLFNQVMPRDGAFITGRGLGFRGIRAPRAAAAKVVFIGGWCGGAPGVLAHPARLEQEDMGANVGFGGCGTQCGCRARSKRGEILLNH